MYSSEEMTSTQSQWQLGGTGECTATGHVTGHVVVHQPNIDQYTVHQVDVPKKWDRYISSYPSENISSLCRLYCRSANPDELARAPLFISGLSSPELIFGPTISQPEGGQWNNSRAWGSPVGDQTYTVILIEHDDNGVVHQTRAFNTETAEQLNSWLSGFESQLRQMSDVNYDFFIHVLMMIYGEGVEDKVVEKELGLSDAFWAEATGN
jgi:hypothetical protein